jgi:DNA polymerase V
MQFIKFSPEVACSIPLFLEPVRAGFPSPAQDYVEQTLDLNQLCIRHPAATYFVRVEGDSMMDAGIHPGDLLVVDRAVDPGSGHFVIASWNGEMTVKELQLKPTPRLIPHNPAYPELIPQEGTELDIFGVVVFVVRSCLYRP